MNGNNLFTFNNDLIDLDVTKGILLNRDNFEDANTYDLAIVKLAKSIKGLEIKFNNFPSIEDRLDFALTQIKTIDHCKGESERFTFENTDLDMYLLNMDGLVRYLNKNAGNTKKVKEVRYIFDCIFSHKVDYGIRFTLDVNKEMKQTLGWLFLKNEYLKPNVNEIEAFKHL